MATAGALMMGGCATPVIVDPSWAELPAAEAMGDAYPTFASMAGLRGRAQLSCVGLPSGRLANCNVNWEAPEGLGFGEAALEVAPGFLLSPRTVDGEVSKARIRFHVNFSMAEEEEEETEPYVGPDPDPAEVAMATRLAEQMIRQFSFQKEGADLNVDEDRRVVVERILREAQAEFESEEIAILALALARVLTTAQIESLIAGQWPTEPLPSFETLIRTMETNATESSDGFPDRLRQKYCALYACEAKWPEGSPGPRHNRPPAQPASQAASSAGI